MPFGLKNAAQTFQCLMDSVLQDLPFLYVYLVTSWWLARPRANTCPTSGTLFERLSEHGLIVNPAKCQFGLSAIDFLWSPGHEGGSGSSAHESGGHQAFPAPGHRQGPTGVLGHGKFLPPICPAGQPSSCDPFSKPSRAKLLSMWSNWTEERVKAFADAAMLAHPLPKVPIALTTDASDYAVGGVHEQFVDGFWQPFTFFSRQLRPAERKYSTFDWELLFRAVRHFRFLLEGRSFMAFVDYKPLTFAIAKVSKPWSARQQRQLSFISEFTTDVRHMAGKSNQVADCLSRSVARLYTLVLIMPGWRH